MMKQVFLSGAMRGIDRKDGLQWRIEATEKLLKDFKVFNPYQGREERETMPDSKLAVIRDKNEVLKSDVLLVNDTFKNTAMIGTSMEILLAFEKKIPVIIFGSANAGNYFLDYHSNVRTETLDDAIKLINTFFK